MPASLDACVLPAESDDKATAKPATAAASIASTDLEKYYVKETPYT